MKKFGVKAFRESGKHNDNKQVKYRGAHLRYIYFYTSYRSRRDLTVF